MSIKGTGDYSQIINSDVIIVTASIGTHQASRSDIMLDQSMLIRDIAKKNPNLCTICKSLDGDKSS